MLIISKCKNISSANMEYWTNSNGLDALSPLPEQHRIVARIDQLMALCDTLEQQIGTATRKQTKLLDALMAQV